MSAPRISIEYGVGRRWFAASLRRCCAVEGAVHAVGVVIRPEFLELAGQVDCVPERDPIQILSPNCPDQPFYEWM
jgi:hypothetical protein